MTLAAWTVAISIAYAVLGAYEPHTATVLVPLYVALVCLPPGWAWVVRHIFGRRPPFGRRTA